MVFIGLNGSAEELQLDAKNRHYIQTGDMDANFRRYMQLPQDELLQTTPPFFSVTFPSCKDTEYAQKYPGKSVVIAAVPTDYAHWAEWDASAKAKRPEDYEYFKRTLCHHFWEQIVQRFPQLDGKADVLDLGTPLSIKHYLQALGGSVASMPHDQHRFAPRNSANLRWETDVPNLYLSGTAMDSLANIPHSGQDIFCGGFAGALTGAVFATGHLLSKYGVKNEQRDEATAKKID